jgi:3-keto-disaccharide hydrolase
MKRVRWAAALLLGLAGALPALPEARPVDGFVPLFNGKDLTGWVNVNCAPGTFSAKGDEIVTTGKPTGFLRTERQYENFVAEFDWMYVPPKPGAVGNSGFFVWADPVPAVGTPFTRGIEVQVLVNLTYKNKKGQVEATSQGDLFSIQGATCVPDRPHPGGWARCLPSENHCKGEREWNHYRVEANDGRVTLAVNGHAVSGVSRCRPRKGYLALEAEGSECHFKNLKIKELPSTHPKPDEVANRDEGFRSLYTGLDLSGWKADDEAKKHWRPKDWVLHCDGKGAPLRREKEHGNVEFMLDFRFPSGEKEGSLMVSFDTGEEGLLVSLTPAGKILYVGWEGTARGTVRAQRPAGQWNRLRLTRKGIMMMNGQTIFGVEMTAPPKQGTLSLSTDAEVDLANLFVRPLK